VNRRSTRRKKRRFSTPAAGRAATTIRAAELEELHKFYDEGQIVELTLVICRAIFTNRFNDTLENIPDLAV
jgi:alkylhydroperoxidase family enzyme